MKIKAPVLKQNDLVGIVAPAGPLGDPEILSRGIQTLNKLGYRTLPGRHVLRKLGYLAGSDTHRIEDLTEMFARPEVRAVFCLRGGYGSLRLLSHLDYDLIRSNPKILVGFSDITALHLAIGRRCGLVTFHGPMIATDFGGGPTAFTRDRLLRVIGKATGGDEITNPPDGPEVVTITPGTAQGELIGGNLTMITALLGTLFEIETKGRILILEEVGESAYRLDRMLSQLRLAGKLAGAAGVIFGECKDCGDNLPGPSFTVLQVLRDRLGDLGIPCFYGLAIGHGRHKATLPLGVQATMDAERRFLRLEEAAVT